MGWVRLANGSTIARGITIPLRVGPYREHPYQWSWIYFHGCEADVEKRQADLGLEWEAPDLVSASRPIEELNDGVHRVWMGDQEYLLYLWSVDPRVERGVVSVRRRGLITGGDDDDPERVRLDEDAYEKYQKRSDML